MLTGASKANGESGKTNECEGRCEVSAHRSEVLAPFWHAIYWLALLLLAAWVWNEVVPGEWRTRSEGQSGMDAYRAEVGAPAKRVR